MLWLRQKPLVNVTLKGTRKHALALRLIWALGRQNLPAPCLNVTLGR